MPMAENLGNLLRGGEFYSPIQARLKTDVFLSELRQPSSRNVPRHEHELARRNAKTGQQSCFANFAV